MKEIFIRAVFHFSVGVILILLWSYFASEWWSPVIRVLGAFNFVPALFAIFLSGEPYRTRASIYLETTYEQLAYGVQYD